MLLDSVVATTIKANATVSDGTKSGTCIGFDPLSHPRQESSTDGRLMKYYKHFKRTNRFYNYYFKSNHWQNYIQCLFISNN